MEATPLPPVRRRHLDELSAFGPVAQHAIGSTPDPRHGSCTDDVARALEVDLAHGSVIGWRRVQASAWKNLRYVGEAFNEDTGRFRNFRTADGDWLDADGSEDTHGRAVLALGQAMAFAPDRPFTDEAAELYDRALPAAQSLEALRARAAALIGCVTAVGYGRTEAQARAWRGTALELAASIHGTFDLVVASASWPFPEPVVTYESALMPRALIIGGGWIGDGPMVEAGLAVLDWLMRTATTTPGHLSPVGNLGWWPKGGLRAQFDQQPLEAAALLHAAEAALAATGNPSHLVEAERAYAWYLGSNDLGLSVAMPERGGCRDGLGADGCNSNQGAESTLSWLIAVERIRAIRARWASAGNAWPKPESHDPRVVVS